MHDPIAAGRRAAFRAIAVQAVVVVLVAAVFLAQGQRHALAAGAGGAALVLGNALAVWLSLDGIRSAGAALARLMLGTAAKWSVAFVVLAAALALWRLPPLPLLVGLGSGLLAYLLALNRFSARRGGEGGPGGSAGS